MYRLAQSILCDSMEAEDVVQDVFVKLWAKRNGLGECANLDAYILTVVRNACLDVLRRRKLRLDKQNEVLSGKEPHSDGVGVVEANDIKKAVEDIIRSLPLKQREIIHLRDVEGYAFEEIALVTESDEAAVRVNLSRARKTETIGTPDIAGELYPGKREK